MGSLGKVLYLSRDDVEKLHIPIGIVIETVEKALLEKAEGRAEMPPKPGIHPQKDAFIHAMPAYLPKMLSAGVKWVSGFPQNSSRGLPYITGLLILNDVRTGVPNCIMDCTWITAKRTGAATAVAAKYLAREDSKTLGVLGCGVQGRSNLEALREVCKDLEKVKAFDTKPENLNAYVEEMTSKYGIEVVPVDSAKRAVENSDVVVTAGPILKHPLPVIEASWLKEGGFGCALDFDSYWTPASMHSVDKFYTDDRDQLAYYKEIGYFSDIPEVYGELEEIVSGKRAGRQTRYERILSMNLGLAIADMATATVVYQTAKRKGTGLWLQL